MPYLIGSIALVIALTAITLVFYDMYKAFRRDLADFNHCDNWDVTLTELDHIHTDTSHSVRINQIIFICRIKKFRIPANIRDLQQRDDYRFLIGCI